MTTQTLYLTRGLPASGKTTWARRWIAQAPDARARVNRDDLRSMLFAAPTYEWQQEALVTATQQNTVRALLAAGLDVVCDDTHLRPKYIRNWRHIAAAAGVDLEVHEFPVDVDEAIRRDATRERPVGADVIRRMAGKYTNGNGATFLPIADEPTDTTPDGRYVPPAGKPDAVIVDIDGTLAHKAPGRDIYDLTRVHEDTPHPPVVEAVEAARAAGTRIIFCSGRDETSRDVTETWLTYHVDRAPDEPLFMRAAGDTRRDSIVKRELFDTHIRHEYDVRYVLDDRNQVVEMWRDLGLTCFQVAEGAF